MVTRRDMDATWRSLGTPVPRAELARGGIRAGFGLWGVSPSRGSSRTHAGQRSPVDAVNQTRQHLGREFFQQFRHTLQMARAVRIGQHAAREIEKQRVIEIV